MSEGRDRNQNYAARRLEKAVWDSLEEYKAGDYSAGHHWNKECSTSGSKFEFIIGVSGGADSVSLLHSAKRAGANILAVHCNFHLRGQESDRDMNFVKDLCKSLLIPIEIRHFDVNSYRESHPGTSVEMACRELRYEWFESLLNLHGALRILVGHNSDDNIETMLLNLFRGSGLAGLRGMQPDNGKVARPLLSISRQEICEYLKAFSQPYIIDSSNSDSTYRRNFIRNELLPMIETRWPGVRKTLSRTIRALREEECASDAFSEIELKDSERLDFARIQSHPAPDWLIRKFAERHGASPILSAQIADTVMSREYFSGKRWETPEGTISGERDYLDFIPKGSTEHSEIKINFEEFCSDEDLIERIKKSPLSEVWLPGKRDEYVVRGPRNSDRIKPLGMSGSKLISKLMKDAKFNRRQKEMAMVAVHVASGEIVWVKDLCRSRKFLVTPESGIVTRLSVPE